MTKSIYDKRKRYIFIVSGRLRPPADYHQPGQMLPPVCPHRTSRMVASDGGNKAEMVRKVFTDALLKGAKAPLTGRVELSECAALGLSFD